jgi:predicted protein tyrosine phosphatase
MPRIHVCSLSQLEQTVEVSGARQLITLINDQTPVARPARIEPDDHLFLAFNDITEPIEGLTPPAVHHVRNLLEFVYAWDRAAPLVVHCWAGISRSTAAAFIALCALDPERPEQAIATLLRRRSPSATPNGRMVAMADDLLDRDGRMIAAIETIGRGKSAFEGEPFFLEI